MRALLSLSLFAAFVSAAVPLGRHGAAPARATAAPERVAAQAPAPTLVVVVTVDQMRADYLTRFGPQLRGGLARLLRDGTVFDSAFHDHAITETAPGHATILSGRFPRSTGITANVIGVEDDAMPLVGRDSGALPGASPRRFRGTVLFDWMAARDRDARALSISMKDRAAILPLGRARQTVLWYAPTGRFTTSRYYADTLPTWIERWNARRVPFRYAGRVWTPLLADSAYAERDDQAETGGEDPVFPHALPADSALAVNVVRGTPFIDEIVLDAAIDGVRAMGLGTRARPDLLAVSLSATDVVGHRWGPDSREMHDQILRLDRALGAFLDSLYTLRDPSRVIVALTADHGVARLPEIAGAGQGGSNAPRRVTLDAVVDSLGAWLEARRVPRGSVGLENGALFVDRAALAAAKVSEDSVVDRFVRAASAVPGVLRVDRFAALARADTVHDAIARRWVHMLPPEYPVPVVVTLTPGSVWGTRTAAEHGSPHDYDAHVPLILAGAPFRAGHVAARVRVVDLAPTLARVLGAKPSERIDGRVLEEALR
ncbi:type I phosphodiesterase/nucleotide pyrophosphatase [Gemmatirosa kalamazoonensis]|uniref:Type I phosphodiesterase/nucleotide pyrophosphatase n=1 Tax=Gemmatirosa kalamazoonensis TaxID=861299 RepID=W0RGT2_9BACT|nr:alkaline phosphatase family protein [Gemmatirosa kalamazoonensis]AHG89637.1 type I phosphodiesterase/nucleotide pyrophosphatase [Gemmatirosa kalamazoonensis]